MCGITGFRAVEADPRSWAADLPGAIASLHHRGPDDGGQWLTSDKRTGLGHRRLSILDLSRHGHQPMFSACGQWAMVFNGEIYNFREIRADLEPRGHRFAGTGDSEVILAAFAEWGPEAVTRFVGMFAIALWHEPKRELHLLRDRLGVKPLHYFWNGGILAFGSELKALRAFTGWSPRVDTVAMADFLRYGYIADPRTIYQGVFKLPPAHRLVLDSQGHLTISRYWSVLEHVGRRATHDEEDLAEELEALMIDAFKYRMIADVPVGMFLSGGVDSSVVTALLQAHCGQQVKTFTIGFDVPAFDESPQAAEVARHLGTEHHCRMLKIDDAKAILPTWGDLFDEPFGDESGIPTLLVSQVAAEHVKVVLSADGGDESFSGYDGYTSTLDAWDKLTRMKWPLRAAMGRVLRAAHFCQIDDWVAERLSNSAFSKGLRRDFTTRLCKIGERVGARDIGELFSVSLMHFRPDEVGVLTGFHGSTRSMAGLYPGMPGDQISLWDLDNYLPGDILTKVDRATMAASIEGREPLIDHRIVEFALSTPFSLRRGSLGPKHLLKKVLYRYVPRPLVDRPKRGFAVPVKQWLATDLRELVQQHLGQQTLKEQGFLEPKIVGNYLARLWKGDSAVQQKVWLLLAFQMWHRRWMSGPI